MKQTGQVYAMKIMNKWDMLKRGEVRARAAGGALVSPAHFLQRLPYLTGVVLPGRKGRVGEGGPALDHAAALRLPG